MSAQRPRRGRGEAENDDRYQHYQEQLRINYQHYQEQLGINDEDIVRRSDGSIWVPPIAPKPSWRDRIRSKWGKK